MADTKPIVNITMPEDTAEAERDAAIAEGKVEVEMVAVRITRDQNTVIETEVQPQEVPILEYVHMLENVEVVDDADTGTVMVDPNAEMEFQRLVNKYDHKDERLVRAVFPGGPRDLAEFGFKVTGRAAKPVASSVKVRKPVKKAASKK